ncbi:Holliday junction branch migration protein RuvA [Candidatus Uabimicrobium sp. HlEnr_7]|uniref:Holliday junction branch migration protein RuvA n=1 Tax=Candidatus Uabimicrobium helgolandensis TaxID=3095367 RepID=UPI003556275B
MLEYINGKVISCYDGDLILDIGSMAFSIKVSTHAEMQFQTGQNVKVFTALSIRDDAMKLFGFANSEERIYFHKLQTISGVGPAMALNILSGGAPEDLCKAILTENLTYFKKIKGVGPKTAKRIILELKGTISSIPIPSGQIQVTSTRTDGINALVSLGYNQMTAATIIDQILSKEPEILLDELIKLALQEM